MSYSSSSSRPGRPGSAENVGAAGHRAASCVIMNPGSSAGRRTASSARGTTDGPREPLPSAPCGSGRSPSTSSWRRPRSSPARSRCGGPATPSPRTGRGRTGRRRWPTASRPCCWCSAGSARCSCSPRCVAVMVGRVRGVRVAGGVRRRGAAPDRRLHRGQPRGARPGAVGAGRCRRAGRRVDRLRPDGHHLGHARPGAGLDLALDHRLAGRRAGPVPPALRAGAGARAGGEGGSPPSPRSATASPGSCTTSSGTASAS